MDSYRRSFDRSREPSLKKPRLAEELSGNNRHFPQRPQPPPAAAVSGKFRQGGGVSGSNASSQDSYQPQNMQQQQQQHLELISQYRTALAELTFNSKPIITNLTIIAGENLLAAKAIAATICTNIIEVPSDQKLPSLYLLDSIVKNIGRDYVKYFAVKLPEVFCKAYRQVDSTIHTGMRHLFGTWKGIFPPQTLQVIEKELVFTSAVNGSSSGGTASRPDSQQRPPQSIHVNPKYLEARQRLQQSSQDADKSDIALSSSNKRPWEDLPINTQRSKRKISRENEKGSGASIGEYEYGSEPINSSNQGIRRDNEIAIGPGLNKQRNGFDLKNKVPNYMLQRPEYSDLHMQAIQSPVNRNTDELSKSWKNAEEEEYMWDDLNSRLMDYGAATNVKPTKPLRTSNSEIQEFEDLMKTRTIHDVGSRIDRESSVDSQLKEKETKFSLKLRGSPRWPAPEPPQPNKVSSSFSYLNNSVTGSSGTAGQQRIPSQGNPPPSLSAHHSHQQTQSLSRLDIKAPQTSGQSKLGRRSQQNDKNQSLLPQEVNLSKSNRQIFDLPSTQKLQLEQKQSEPPGQAKKKPVGQTMAAALKSGRLSKNSLTDNQLKTGSHDPTTVPSLPSGSSSNLPEKKVEQSPLSPGLQPSSGTGSSAFLQTDTAVKNDLNPLSNLLSSLVAKGLISSSSKQETPTVLMPTQIHNSSSVDLSSISKPLPAKTPTTVSQSTTMEVRNRIGFDFKPDKIREFHPSVINDLYDDVPHQCNICGLRLKLQERFDRHMEWHDSENSAPTNLNKASRKWFTSSNNWMSRDEGLNALKIEPIDEETKISEEQVVLADENQCICILCGGLFEDFYSEERNEWMFKGAAYMNLSSEDMDLETRREETGQGGLIVHADCISNSSIHDLGLSNGVKMEMDA